MAVKLKFGKKALEALEPAPPGKRVEYHDSETKGLCLRVTDSGAKSFCVFRRVQGKVTRITIGPFPDVSVEQARRKAEEINGAIAQGKDPSEERRKLRGEATFEDLFTWYLETISKPTKRTWMEDEGKFKRHCDDLSSLKASKVSKGLVRSLHQRIGQESGQYAANRVLELVSVVYNKANAHEVYVGPNPCDGVEAFREQSRDRRLMPNEFERFLQAVAAEEKQYIKDYVYISLLSGARRSNVLEMRWEEIDFEDRSWRIPRTKNGTPQTIPLEDYELEILGRRKADSDGSPWVFPGTGRTGHMMDPKKGWQRILKRANIEDFRLHDLRRTLGSLMVDTGASIEVIGKTLNHLDPATTAIYARFSMDPIRQAKRKAHGVLSPALDATFGTERPESKVKRVAERIRAKRRNQLAT